MEFVFLHTSTKPPHVLNLVPERSLASVASVSPAGLVAWNIFSQHLHRISETSVFKRKFKTVINWTFQPSAPGWLRKAALSKFLHVAVCSSSLRSSAARLAFSHRSMHFNHYTVKILLPCFLPYTPKLSIVLQHRVEARGLDIRLIFLTNLCCIIPSYIFEHVKIARLLCSKWHNFAIA